MLTTTKALSIAIALLLSISTTAQGFDLLPQNPTSADSIRLVIFAGTCFTDKNPVGVNPYSVTMKNNHVSITFNKALAYDIARSAFVFPGVPPPPLPNVRYMRYIDIGTLPAGQYTWGVKDENPDPSCQLQNSNGTLPKGLPFTVTDGRMLKRAPYVLANISGHWWNSDDSGSGLFFWQDEKDNTLGAWFTYDKAGAPKWYVFEPKWDRLESSASVDLYEASRPQGSTMPAMGKTTLKAVGKARFVLEGESAFVSRPLVAPRNLEQGLFFSYQFTNEAEKTIGMQRYPGVMPPPPR